MVDVVPFDIVPTKFICPCDGKIEVCIEENNTGKFYYRCLKCGEIYKDTSKFRGNGCVDK